LCLVVLMNNSCLSSKIYISSTQSIYCVPIQRHMNSGPPSITNWRVSSVKWNFYVLAIIQRNPSQNGIWQRSSKGRFCFVLSWTAYWQWVNDRIDRWIRTKLWSIICFSIFNKALRTQNIDIILKMGFFVRDLHRQIEELHSKIDKHKRLTLYRGQGMLNASINNRGSTNCIYICR